MIKILPSLLNSDFFEIKETIHRLEKIGIDELHIDVMDGNFVEDMAFGPKLIRTLRQNTKMLLDVHLMIESPDMKISKFLKTGADTITVHIESSQHIYKVLQEIKSAGIACGIALNPQTPVSSLEMILSIVDQVTVLTINPGTYNEHIIANMYQKIKQLNDLKVQHNLSYKILVDGKVDIETAKHMAYYGADKIVSGGAIFNNNSIEDNIKKLQQAVLQGVHNYE